MGLVNNISAKQLCSLYESIMHSEVVADNPPAIVQQHPEFSSKLIEYIKRVENPNKVGYKNGKWYPYKVSNTEIDIGYGHMINPGENFKAGLTTLQVERLLQHDLKSAATKARYYVNHHFGKNTWENLDQIRREMLTEFAFNLGSLNSFPKFTKAVIYNDIAGMKKEYERSAMINGVRKILGRNQEFYNTFLKDYHGGYYISLR